VSVHEWCEGYNDGQAALWARAIPAIQSTIWIMTWEHLCTVFAACAALDKQRVSILAEHLWGRP
jgi:hypothetical protein